MNLCSATLIFYILNGWLYVVIHGLNIGRPCENGVKPANCTLKRGAIGSSAELCKKPETKEAEVWCHIKTQHLFYLYYCCEEIGHVIYEGFAVSGVPTKPNEFLYMAALGWYSGNAFLHTYFRCGAVMISKNFALTAAHCANIDGDEPITVLPRGGALYSKFESRYTIDKVFEHPDYDPDFVYNDIALIKLYGNYTGPVIDLWRRPYIANTNFTAIGYGDTTFAGTSSSRLLKVFLQLVANKNCQRFYEPDFEIPRGVIPSQICAKDSKNIMDTCQGDSGGPLIMTVYGDNGVKKEYLVGITSFGHGCAEAPPGVYTRVTAYIDWINNITGPYREVNEKGTHVKEDRFYWD